MRDRLVRLAYRFLWNRDEAEDVVHDALADFHARSVERHSPNRPWSWLYRVVVRRCFESGRRKLRRRRHLPKYAAEAIARSAIQSPQADAGAREALREVLQELPRRQREVIVLRHLEEMSYERIAELLDISPATARVHAQAGREALRELLVARHPGWFDRLKGRDGK